MFNTVTDALARKFSVSLLCDAIRAVNVKPDDGAKAEAELGAVPVQHSNVPSRQRETETPQ